MTTILALGVTQTRAANTVDMTGVPLKFVYSSTDSVTGNANPNGKSNGNVVVYRNVGTSSGGVAIDAVVTTQLAGATIGDYDSTGSASNSNPIPGTTATENFQVDMTTSSAYGTATFVFDFYEARTWTRPGTGTSLVLNNVRVTSIDLDGSGGSDYQYTDLTGFQSYTLTSPTSVNVSSPSSGVVRFLATDDSNGANRPADRVQVTYDSMSRFTAVFGNVLSGKLGYFGLLFVVDPWADYSGTKVATPNTFNSPPTSTSTSRYVTTGVASTISLDDFGTYADVDNNPFQSVKIVALPTSGTLEYYNGSAWATVTLNQVISVTDIQLGYLRFTGSATDSIGFQVFDGLALSSATYTITLSVAPNPQSITFSNPGGKAPSQSFSSGASASSNLTPILTSLTTGVCTVSGLTITTVSSGVCTIKATQPGDATWSTAEPVTQTFNVSSLASQTITFVNPGDRMWSGSSITIASGATASSSLTVSLVSFTPTICTVSGLTITAIAQGTCRVRASQAGNGSFAPASPVEQTFIISSLVVQSASATTQAASSVTETTATLNGSVNANGTSSAVTFCWGTQSNLSGCSSVTATPGTATGSSATAASYALTSLVGSTTYYFQVSLNDGTGPIDGAILSFTTSAPSSISPTTTIAPTSSACVTPTITTGAIPNGYVGEAYSWTPVVTSGSFSWSVTTGTLPSGLSLSSSTGTIAGTPLTAQSSTFEISAAPTSCTGSVTAGRISVTIVILPPGRVSGIVWIDINKNGKRESKEPLLPGVTVTLSSDVTSASVSSRALSTVTGADGSYLIKGVDVGSYVVTAKLSTSTGLTKSWDSKGSADWKVPVSVISLAEAKADFAAVGKTTMTGTVVSTSSVSPVNAKIACTWAGIDGTLGTDDDVVYSATANSSGSYSIPSTPYGEFSCVASDAVSGKKSTGSEATIKAGSRGTVAVAALRFGILPVTGSSPQPHMLLAMVLFLLGIALVGASRRRRLHN